MSFHIYSPKCPSQPKHQYSRIFTYYQLCFQLVYTQLFVASELGKKKKNVPNQFTSKAVVFLLRNNVSLEDPSETFLNIKKVKIPFECCTDLLKFGVYVELLHLTERHWLLRFIPQYQIMC